ncbi:aminopeptidase P family N-terminal domain-containing protein [Mammaliicoccus vitulinus]|uniref:M24 family metallopeptidase n=1 Tax=Mammaliicoccus vitulinus TaxID=71237 RepID=UPI0019528DA6|nr:aminopeptidase P family N-terminal domain-containing protein [Mammaliicoccus vitulinus]MBM6629238.1 aminopeptidase P family N-terminal domain-containing protein [Mammaliicoccus vitulinus]MBO3077462.1 aminopeptidase P family N-terminal domain-containing protein [Mammaliicoccus vitulinus]
MNIQLKKTNPPVMSDYNDQIILSDKIYADRKDNLISSMENKGVDVAVIYADREHAANFEYFTGFVPRFEEALLVVHRDGKSYLVLGNENMKMAKFSRLSCEAIHAPILSLPSQPMYDQENLDEILTKSGITSEKVVGIIGWKLFTTQQNNSTLFDLPYFIIESIQSISKSVLNITDILISPLYGIRTMHSAEEIAYLEYGSTLAGVCMFNTLNNVNLKKTEVELANSLSYGGQPHTVTTITANGDRFSNAIVYPRDKKISLGHKISLTVGYKGGLSSRAGYVANTSEDLNESEKQYLEKVAIPYYTAITTWLENFKIGTKGDDFYNLINDTFPKEQYGWELNPGHFTATEEWLSSPFYPNSQCTIKSGQVYQIDIIPSVKGYGGVSCEDGVAIADHDLRNKIKETYPDLWQRFERRRNYIIEELGIHLPEEVLPMNDIVAYYRPFLLNQETTLVSE